VALVSAAVINVGKWLEGSKFSAFHWLLFFLGLGTFVFDGYCLFVYGAAVPLLLEPFHVDLTQAGIIGSYAPIGAGLGALVFGSVADQVGRKKTIVLCIAIFCIGMALCGISSGPVSFSIFRIITGFGVGGCMPNMVALTTEYAPLRSRSTMVSMMLSGIQVGGIVAALLGLWLFTPFGWRAVFIAGFVPILLLPLYLKYLPESPLHLVKHDRLDQLRTILRRVRPYEPVPDDAILQTDLAPAQVRSVQKAPIAAIFREGRGVSTVMLWLVYFLNLYTIYGFTIWLPKLVMNQGYSLASGLTGLLILSTVSIFGSYAAGVIADRLIGSRPTLFIFYVLAFLSIVATGYATHLWILMVCVSLAGAGFNGAQNSLNAYVALYYPPGMRSTAVGFCYGIGRMGSILGPAITGFLMSLHFTYHHTLLAIAIPGLIPAIAIFAVRDQYNFARQLASQQAVLGSA
jgi:AAHS family benzoate transporter-like MFS transporter